MIMIDPNREDDWSFQSLLVPGKGITENIHMYEVQ